MSIEEIEKQCIKLMQKRNSDTKIFETLSKQADEGKKTYTCEGKRYTQKQYDNIYKSLIEYNNNSSVYICGKSYSKKFVNSI